MLQRFRERCLKCLSDVSGSASALHLQPFSKWSFSMFKSIFSSGFKFAFFLFAVAALAVILKSPMLFGAVVLTGGSLAILKIATGVGFAFGAIMGFFEHKVNEKLVIAEDVKTGDVVSS
jgi:hypothetical protein